MTATRTLPADRPSLVDPAFHAGDPYPYYRHWRAESPVFWDDVGGLWVLTRHADVVAVSRDPERFCSREGILPADIERGASEDSSIIFMDPPKHRDFRRLVQPSLSRRQVAAFEPWIRDLARELVAAVEPGSIVDFVEDVAIPLPISVIARLLGVPEADHEQFRVWSDAAIEAAVEITPENAAATVEMLDYLEAAVIARRADPADDLISGLATADIGGEALTDHELKMFCMTLLVAGNETTRNLLSAGALALARHPDARRALASSPSTIELAVEEMLRWESPIVGFMRTATRDTEVRGQEVARGERLLLVYASANRDEEVFGDDAERFVPSRDPNPHLAFGIGEHFCLGASLARLEGRILFEELLARYPDLELAGEERWLRSTLVRGLTTLPIAFAEPRS